MCPQVRYGQGWSGKPLLLPSEKTTSELSHANSRSVVLDLLRLEDHSQIPSLSNGLPLKILPLAH